MDALLIQSTDAEEEPPAGQAAAFDEACLLINRLKQDGHPPIEVAAGMLTAALVELHRLVGSAKAGEILGRFAKWID